MVFGECRERTVSQSVKERMVGKSATTTEKTLSGREPTTSVISSPDRILEESPICLRSSVGGRSPFTDTPESPIREFPESPE